MAWDRWTGGWEYCENHFDGEVLFRHCVGTRERKKGLLNDRAFLAVIVRVGREAGE